MTGKEWDNLHKGARIKGSLKGGHVRKVKEVYRKNGLVSYIVVPSLYVWEGKRLQDVVITRSHKLGYKVYENK